MLDNYEVDRFGVIHQIDATPITYDKQYISYYEDLSDRTIKLGYQRLGWVLGITGQIPRSVLEIGYGTGTFVEAAKITGVADCAGCDITRFPLPEGVCFVDWEEALAGAWDLVAMFDVLEHIPDLGFLARFQARHLAIAVPYCVGVNSVPRAMRGSRRGACVCPTSTCTISTVNRWWRCWGTMVLSA
ncbi:methyltransferase domain-containing protein [Mesorhizobium sp. LNJC405B00]|uniref:methyltransferase domain-containing protein n=1 Tax=unclassified Mesorhizobium TaxID=325217 RepID=UPI000AEE2F6D|nr:methyltransferase domain-containing protein [Mesorhizobium sp. LNJC405B00]